MVAFEDRFHVASGARSAVEDFSALIGEIYTRFDFFSSADKEKRQEMKLHHAIWLTIVLLAPGVPIWAQGTLFVEGDNVGIGTSNPLNGLHIKRSAVGSGYLMENTDGLANARIAQQYVTNTGFWVVRGVTDDFSSGSNQLSVNLGTGDVTVEGNLTVNGTFSNPSSRTQKKNIESVILPNILSKIASVPVVTFDFIDGQRDAMGLIAEEFHTIFGRGTDKAIVNREVQMALWLAVQELTERNGELGEANTELNERNAALEKSVEELEKRLAGIEARLAGQ